MNKNELIIKKINIFFNKIPLLYYFFPYLLHILSTNYLIKKELILKNNYRSLDDIIFNNTPNLHNYEYIVNIFILFLCLPLFYKIKIKNFITIFKYFSISTILRTITSCSTILPSITECRINNNNKNNISNYLIGHCNDKIFSGHTSFMIILFYVIYKNNLIKYKYLSIYGSTIFINSLFIIITRAHYTVDVILAYIIIPCILLIIKDL